MTDEWRRGDLTDGGGVGLNLVALEISNIVLVADALVGGAALAQDGIDGGELGFHVLSFNVLVKDNDIAVGDDILGGGVADLHVWLVGDWSSKEEWQEGSREGHETLGKLHDVL